MKLIKEAKATTKDMIDLYKDMFSKESNWELYSSFEFYKQSFRYFMYGTRRIIMWILGSLLVLTSVLFLPFAIIIRGLRK